MSETRTRETYTGKLNVCLDCDYYTIIDMGAEEHSKATGHFVFQDHVNDKPLGKEAAKQRRGCLKEMLRG